MHFLEQLLDPPCDKDEFIPIDIILMETLRIRRQLPPDISLPGRLNSTQQLRELHDRLTREHDKLFAATVLEHEFPKPPLPGNTFIEPVDRPTEILREGREMRHCVVTRARQVVCGELYIYRLLRPERATFSLRRETKDRWQLEEISGVGDLTQRIREKEDIDAPDTGGRHL